VEILANSRAYADPPFTNEEVFRAFAVFLPQAAIEAARSDFAGPDDGPFMGHVTTSMLLILCTFSDELAARVLAYSPDLEPQVRRVLEDPEGFIQSIRDEAAGAFGPQDQE
jgi:hypothetical protein